MHQTRHWATSPGGQEPLFAQRKKAKPLLLLLFEGRNPDCSTWQRMLALLARFPGEALLVRNLSNRGLACKLQAQVAIIPILTSMPLEQVCKNRANRLDWHLHEGLPWWMSASHTHRFEVVSFSRAWNEY